jgi:hypothetical protein
MTSLRTCLLLGALVLIPATGAEADRYRPTVLYNGPTLAGASHSHGHLPDVSDARPDERRAAVRFLERVEQRATGRFRDVDAIAELGFRRGAGMRFMGQDRADGRVRTPFVHFKSAAYERDGRVLDPNRPEALVYWRRPRGGLVLVGFMFRAPSRQPPPDRGLGPYMAWHAHAFCDDRREAGNPRQFHSDRCASGYAHHGATQMTHVWLAAGLRFAHAMEVPARRLGIFVEDAPAAYSGSHGSAGAHHPDHGAHVHGVELSRAELVVGGAWTLSVLAPLIAGAALLMPPGRRLRRRAIRFFGIACLGGIGVTHAADLAEHVDHAAYLAALFCALIVSVSLVGMVLALARDPSRAWLAGGALAAGTIVGFCISRTVGLPDIGDHVGEWEEPVALLALAFESILVLLALPVAIDRLLAHQGRAG